MNPGKKNTSFYKNVNIDDNKECFYSWLFSHPDFFSTALWKKKTLIGEQHLECLLELFVSPDSMDLVQVQCFFKQLTLFDDLSS